MKVVGKTVSDLIVFAQQQARDQGAVAPSGPTAIRHINDAVRDLARDVAAFRRTEVFSPSAGVATLRPASFPEKILRVRLDTEPLAYRTVEELDADPDMNGWRDTPGTPTAWTGIDVVVLAPAPDTEGDTLTFGTSALPEEAGHTIAGHGYHYEAISGAFWLPGDGVWTNADTATGIVFVEYAYTPDSVQPDTVIPDRFVRALTAYLLGRVILTAEGDAHRAAYAGEKAQFATATVAPVWEFRHYDAVQRAIATGNPLPKLLADDYERIVKKAIDGGDPTGRGLLMNREFLQGAVQAAVVEGKAVPKEVLDAFSRYVHDLTPYGRDLEPVLPWDFCQREIQRSIAIGAPIDEMVLASYLRRQTVTEAGPPVRSLRGEVF